MQDQAETLRQLMREMQAPGSLPGPVVPVISLRRGREGGIAAPIGACLAREGLRVLLTDASRRRELSAFAIAADQRPGRATWNDVAEGRARPSQALSALGPRFDAFPSIDRDFGVESWGRLVDRLEREGLGEERYDVVLVDADLEKGGELASTAGASVVILTPDRDCVEDAFGLIRQLRRQPGRVGIAVDEVADGREALDAFRRLQARFEGASGSPLEYLGHRNRHEKSPTKVANGKFLLDLETRDASAASLELLARRLRTSLIPVRFQEEAAREANSTPSRVPGNSARFWRALLGEGRSWG